MKNRETGKRRQTMSQDFSKRSSFPGEDGNILDTILHFFEKLEKIPSIIISFIIFSISSLVFWDRWIYGLLFLGFILLDWILIFSLPVAGRSFGPVKPPLTLLFVFRIIIAFLPAYLSFPVQAIGTILVVYGFWIEPHTIKISHQKLSTPKLNGNQPIRLLHLGDLHIEKISRREKQLNRMIHDLSPDVILFSGDILNLSYRRDPASRDLAQDLIRDWSAPQGIYFVMGSPAVDVQDFIPQMFENLSVNLLQDQKVTLQIGNNQIELVGLTCTQRPHVDGPKLKGLFQHPNGKFQILLYHTPDLAPIAAQAGIDLQLSGHTHGGQIRLPFWGALVTGSLYGKRFEAGRYQIDQMTLYVTRGIGMEGAGAPRVRFLCPPEITLWEIGGVQ
jgi:uncharacterized protein